MVRWVLVSVLMLDAPATAAHGQVPGYVLFDGAHLDGLFHVVAGRRRRRHSTLPLGHGDAATPWRSLPSTTAHVGSINWTILGLDFLGVLPMIKDVRFKLIYYI
jgi:hypothetical protein